MGKASPKARGNWNIHFKIFEFQSKRTTGNKELATKPARHKVAPLPGSGNWE